MLDAERDFNILAYWSGDPSRDAAAAVVRRVRHTFLPTRSGGARAGAAATAAAAQRAWTKFLDHLLDVLDDPPPLASAKGGIRRVYEVKKPHPAERSAGRGGSKTSPELIDGWTWRRVRSIADLSPGGRYVCTGSEPKARRRLPAALAHTVGGVVAAARPASATHLQDSKTVRRSASAPA